VVVGGTAVLKLNFRIHISRLVAKGSIEMLTAVDMLHGLLGGVLVLGGVIGNAAVLKLGGGHRGASKVDKDLTRRLPADAASWGGALLRLAGGYFRQGADEAPHPTFCPRYIYSENKLFTVNILIN
jgi:hypothetical protein